MGVQDDLAELEGASRAGETGVVVHGTSVSCQGQGVLFIGPSGAGKSSAALVLLGLGAQLIADDRSRLSFEAGRVLLSAPATLPHLIEARGVGLLPAAMAGPTPLVLVVNMGRQNAERLPKRRHVTVLGQEVALLNATDSVHFPYAVLQYVKGLKVPVRDA